VTAIYPVTLYNEDCEQITTGLTSVLTRCRRLFLCSFLHDNNRLLSTQLLCYQWK